jgi:hypothetical protein
VCKNCKDEISVSHDDENENVFWDVARFSVYSGRSLPTFQGCLLPPSSGR